jgi:hypothetical protein
MMTRKDYIATASILESMKDEMPKHIHFTLVDQFAEMMEKDNPRVDAKRFFSASGCPL